MTHSTQFPENEQVREARLRLGRRVRFTVLDNQYAYYLRDEHGELHRVDGVRLIEEAGMVRGEYRGGNGKGSI